jgi:ribonuclease R
MRAPAAPARGRAIVAVLERRGRFLTAEPLFPPRELAEPSPRARRSGPMVVRGGGSGPGEHARPGDLVLVAAAARGSGASIVRVLGRPEVARDLIEGLMLDRGLSRGFDEAVEREAREASSRVALGEWERRDLRELPTFTIDPASARDFDDAISAEELAGGGTRVWVHIADVAAHVTEGSALDREARRRATSVYVPGAVEPMLPHALSSDACSLMPGVDRAAVTVELEMQGATVARAAFYRSLIRSDERLDYEHVDRIFAGVEAAAAPWGESLRAARAVAAALARRREQSGALVVDSEEPEFSFDEQGNVTEISGRSQTESHRLIEHLMIAANEAVASLLQQRGVPCLFRVHENPDPERIERLLAQLASLEVATPPLPERMSSSQAAELLGAVSRRVDEHVRGTGRGRIALSSLVLRSLKQAYYSPRNLGHAGLHSPSYCHFTSPIRRYPDLVCHRALLSAVGGGEREPRAGEMVELGVWTSERERDAMKLERDGDDMARCFVLERLLHELGPRASFAGEIAGLISAGAFVAFDAEGKEVSGDAAAAPLFEGMLPVRLLRAGARAAGAPPASAGRRGGGRGRGERPDSGDQREWWELNGEGTILRGERTGATLRLGDPIAVAVARVDTVRGRVDLVPGG